MLPVREWEADGLESVSECPACGSAQRKLLHTGMTDRVFFSAPGEWTLFQCRQCRSAYLDPRPTAATMALAYRNYYTHAGHEPSPANLLRRARRALGNGYRNTRFGTSYRPALPLSEWILKLFPGKRAALEAECRGLPRPTGGGRLLDVGCGSGDFVQLATCMGWNAEGVDVDPVAVAAARERGMCVSLGDIGIFAREREVLDAITLSHVLEHVHAPHDLLAACYRLLRKDGVLWLETPNIDSLGHMRFGAAWLHLDTPRHLVLFNHETVGAALRRAGFSRIELQPHSPMCVHTFGTSRAIARGLDPNVHRRLPPSTRLAAAMADRRARHEPALREVITLKAWK